MENSQYAKGHLLKCSPYGARYLKGRRCNLDGFSLIPIGTEFLTSSTASLSMLEDRTHHLSLESHVRVVGAQFHRMNAVHGAGIARYQYQIDGGVAEIDSKIGQTKMREKEMDKVNEVHYVNKKTSKEGG